MRTLQQEIDQLAVENKRLKTELRELSARVGSMEEDAHPSEDPGPVPQRARRSDSKEQAAMRALRAEHEVALRRAEGLELEIMRKRNEREEARTLCTQYAATIAKMENELREQEELRLRCEALEAENRAQQLELEDLAMAQRDDKADNMVCV